MGAVRRADAVFVSLTRQLDAMTMIASGEGVAVVRRVSARFVITIGALIWMPFAAATPASAAPPAAVRQCMKGGWRTLTDASGHPFRNQGQCIAFVIRHPVSLADLTDPTAFTGTAAFTPEANGCSFEYQTFDASYPGSAAVGTVDLHIAGCVIQENFQGDTEFPFTYTGTFTLTTNVGSVSGSTVGGVSITASLGLMYTPTLTVTSATGSFAGSTGALLFSATPNSANQSPTPFVGSVSLP
jgi:hypothetical protein